MQSQLSGRRPEEMMLERELQGSVAILLSGGGRPHLYDNDEIKKGGYDIGLQKGL